MPDGRAPVTFPVERASQEEIDTVSNFVIRRLARIAMSGGPTPIGPHDQHTSVHSRNTFKEEDQPAPPPGGPARPLSPPKT